MTTVGFAPGLLIGGGSAPINGTIGELSELDIIYQNLISGGAQTFTSTGSRVLVMDSGAIGMASTTQVGSYLLNGNEATETTAQVSANFETLKLIAAFCRANGISVQVDASLNDGTTFDDGTNALVDQWASVAAAAGLPITSIEDVNEQGITNGNTAEMFASQALVEVSAIQTLIKAYTTSSYCMTASNLAVGDMEAGNVTSISGISQWWNAYNIAAQNAGISPFSFVTAEMGWDAPWLSVQPASGWQKYINAISELSKSDNMALNVIVQGMQTDTSGNKFIVQQEQHAAQLATYTASMGIIINNILLRTWQPFPVGVNLITAPDSMSNSAAEITAIYPLYQAGSITVQGTVGVSVPNQVIVTTNLNTSLTGICVNWDQADVYANCKLAVVIISQTGTLNATQYQHGTVSKLSSNILILNGNSAEISAEISSIWLDELNSGSDTLDVECFGADGQLSDNQINVLALANGQQSSVIDSTSDQQGWISSSFSLNTGTAIGKSLIFTSETLYWNTTAKLDGSLQQAPAYVKLDSIHQPLAESGVKKLSIFENGKTISVLADCFDARVDNPYSAPGGYANNAGNFLQAANNITWQANTLKVDPFNPANQVTSFKVASTIYNFDQNSGVLQESTDTLSPSPLSSVNFFGTSVANTFSTAFDLGGIQITEFNTGLNPAWQQAWGINFKSATLTYDYAGQLVEEFLQGGTNQPLYSIDNVYNPTTGQIWEQFQTAAPPEGYSYLATGPLYITQFNTGDNPNWDYFDWGNSVAADTEVVSTYLITDNFVGVAFAGIDQAIIFSNGTVYGADDASADMVGCDDVIHLGVNDTLHLNGDRNTIVGTINETITQNGTGYLDTLGTGSVINNTATKASFTVNGTGIKVVAAAADTVIDNGTNNSFTFLNGGTFSEANIGASDLIVGNGVTSWLNAAGQTIQATGSNNVITTNINANVAVAGDRNTVGVGSGSTISLNGISEVVYGSSLLVNIATNTTATVNDIKGSIVISGTNIAVTASHEAISTKSGSSFSLVGSDDTVDLVANTKVLLGGVVKIGFITGLKGHDSIIASPSSQTVSGFSATNGDRLDLSQIFTGVEVSETTLSKYIKATWSGFNTTLTIAGPHGSDSVTLSHLGAVSLQNLIDTKAFVLPTYDQQLHENSASWTPNAIHDQEHTICFQTSLTDKNAQQYHSDLNAHFSRIQVHLLESPKSLTDHEMLEMFLHVVLSGQDTRSLTRELLTKYNSLGATIAAPLNELANIPGLGKIGATALKLLHATTVNVLRKEVEASTVLECWDQLIDYLSISLKHEHTECFHILFLDNRGVLLSDEVQAIGTINQVSVYPREIVRRCLELHASALIMVHNHPSGDPQPSPQDVTITLAVQRAAAIMGIALHDHIIIGRFGYCSFRHEKLI